MLKKKYRFAVLFDFDGVLIDSYLAHYYSTRNFCQNYGIEFTKSLFENHIFGNKNEEWLPYIFKRYLSKEEIDA